MSNMQALTDYLHRELSDDVRIAIETEIRDDHSEIKILPASSRQGGQYAKVKLGIHEKYDLTVDIGRANHFDIPDAYSDDGRKYILNIIRACADGKLREIVTKKNNLIVKSRIEINLPSGKTSFNYSDGLFKFGGEKEEINYVAYPDPK